MMCVEHLSVSQGEGENQGGFGGGLQIQSSGEKRIYCEVVLRENKFKVNLLCGETFGFLEGGISWESMGAIIKRMLVGWWMKI